MTYTPGPWAAAFRSSMMYGERYWVFSAVTEKPVAMVHLTESSQEATNIHKANAHLMATSPEMYDLLIEWLDTPFFETKDEWQKWVDDYKPRVEIAIAKVEGK